MSGTIVNNVARASGTIAATPGGLDWSTAVVTGSTVTVEAGRGYFINTTSNACTVTLPASPEVGDQIVLADYARTWANNAVTLDSNGNNFQGEADTYTVDYDTVGQSLNIVYADSTKGWLPVSDDAVAFDHGDPPTQKAIFGYGSNSSGKLSMTNLVNSSGVVATDVTGVGTARHGLAAAGYGGDKGIFGYGYGSSAVSTSNLVNNSGVVGNDVSGVGTARNDLAAAEYGGDKAIFGYGKYPGASMTNKVSNSGVVASDTSGVGTGRMSLAAAGYGLDKAIFGFGYLGSSDAYVSMTNLVSNSGVVAADVSGVGTNRASLGATEYGSTGQAIFAYGYTGSVVSLKNLVNNSGVVASDVSGVGTARGSLAAASYGGDKAIFGYGAATYSLTNLVSNTGVISADVTGVGTGRTQLAACEFSYAA